MFTDVLYISPSISNFCCFASLCNLILFNIMRDIVCFGTYFKVHILIFIMNNLNAVICFIIVLKRTKLICTL